MRQTTMAPLIGWSRVFPAAAGQVREARQFLAGILDGSPMADDALLCLSELATNAVVHSRSRERGGQLRVGVERHGGRVRVEVCDQGGPWAPAAAHGGENGRGLLVVAQLARSWGRTGSECGGWAVWYEIEAA